jgi:hypothetical protein
LDAGVDREVSSRSTLLGLAPSCLSSLFMRLGCARELSRVEEGEMLLASAQLLDDLPGGNELERAERGGLRLEVFGDEKEVAWCYTEFVELLYGE